MAGVRQLRLASGRSFAIAIGLAAAPSASFGVGAAANGLQSKAKDVLFRCLERTNMVTLTAIAVQRSSAPGCPPMMQFKVEQDNGKKAVTTLQPLSWQGSKVIHDGKDIRQYYPDENRIIIQPAPKRTKEDFEERRGLSEKNYRFTMERNGEIAGRETMVVTAAPKFSELPSRKYSIDISKDVLLRLETVEDGRRTTFFDTQAIFFPESVSASSFEFKPVAQVRIIRRQEPERIENLYEAKVQVGFQPLLPKDLPFGFVIREPQFMGQGRAKFVAVRLTDGLLTATVYQWDSRRLPEQLAESTPTRTVNGIKIGLMWLVGDVSEAVNARFLDIFAKEAARAFRGGSEPIPTSPALKREQRTRADSGKDGASDDPGSDNPSEQALMESLTHFLAALMAEVESQ